MREYFKLYFNGKAHHTHDTSLPSSDALFSSSSTQPHYFSNWRTARPIQFDVTKLTHSDKLKCCNKSDDVCCSTNALLGWRRLIQVWQSKELIKKIKMMKEGKKYPTTNWPHSTISTSSLARRKEEKDHRNATHSVSACCTRKSNR